jgi:long-chain acyl-CoA synthetase
MVFDGYQPLTLGRGIRCAAARDPDKPALIRGGDAVSYAHLVARISQVANLAREGFGLRPGDRAVVLAPNDLAYVELVAGLSDAGVIAVTLNPRLTRGELQAILDDCTPRLLFAHPDCLAAVDPAWAPELPLVVLGAPYETLLARAQDRAAPSRAQETDAFAIAYTSGTTGRPKGVLLSHRSRMLTFLAMAGEYGCFGANARFLALTPMCHGAGFVFACASLVFGGTTVLFDRQDPEAIIHRLGQGDVSGVFMVPTHLARISAASPPGARLDHRLKTIISNAAALPQALKVSTLEHFGPGLLHETYGSTEAGIVTNIGPDRLLDKPGSCGLPFPAVELELRDDAGRPVPRGAPGELFVRAPTAFNGYWNRPDDTAASIVDGWVTVGDIATRDTDGFVTIIDRKKDMVISGGLNIYPKEVEDIIVREPGVLEAAVVGENDPEWGERLKAFVVVRDGLEVSPEAIMERCREALGSLKTPRRVVFLSQLPRNASGKVLKAELRRA